jgi:hypothetical protein
MAKKKVAKNKTDKPNGPVSAALLAGGLGSAVLGLVTLAVEIIGDGPFKTSLVWYKPAGPLSGKSGLGILAFFLAWAILHYMWKDKNTDFARISMISFVLLAIGLLGTFPPVWHLF